MACLEVVEGFNVGERFQVAEDTLIGRSLSNTICLPDSRASRQHARIVQKDDSYYIQDEGSANGTMLRGETLPAQQLFEIFDGDEIHICATRMIFHLEPHDKKKSPPAAAGGGLAGALGGRPGGKHAVDGMEVRVLSEGSDGESPAVNLTLDANQSMVMIRDQEKSSEQGIKDALRRLQAMLKVSEALGNVLELEPLMQRILDLVFDIFPASDRAFILLEKENPETRQPELMPVAARRRGGADEDAEEVSISRSIVQAVKDKKQSILSSDAMSDDRFQNQMSIVNLSIRSMMCAPLMVASDILGIIQVDCSKGGRTFNQEDLQILTGISAQAAIAVKNAQLYTAVEQETSRRASLQRYFSPHIVELMMEGALNTDLGGKSYEGTIFFSDIIGFTAMSETMDAAEVVAKLNRYFTAMQKIIYDNGGNVDKFGGDAIMAFWSVPQHTDDDERLATLTGIEMQSRLWVFNLEMVADNLLPVHTGIGLNTGDFVAGNVGSEDKIEFTLIGDNVNLASRIESCAGRTHVFISEKTYNCIAKDVCAVRLPPILFKGKSKPANLFSIRAVRRSDDDWALSIPCDVVTGGGSNGDGMLAAMTGVPSGGCLILYTSIEVAAGGAIEIHFKCDELHINPDIKGVVESVSPREARPGLTYNRVVIADPVGDMALHFLTPGNCQDTELGWEQMHRA